LTLCEPTRKIAAWIGIEMCAAHPVPTPQILIRAIGMDLKGQNARSILRTVLRTGGLIVALYCCLAVYGLYRFGSIGGLVAFIQGRHLYVEPVHALLDGLKPGEPFEALIRLQNLASGRLKVLGSHADCGCMSAQGLPLELMPGESRNLSVHLRSPKQAPTEFRTTITFYVNVAGEQPEAVVRGRLVPPAPNEILARPNRGS
jgi:hypothetical protein